MPLLSQGILLHQKLGLVAGTESDKKGGTCPPSMLQEINQCLGKFKAQSLTWEILATMYQIGPFMGKLTLGCAVQKHWVQEKPDGSPDLLSTLLAKDRRCSSEQFRAAVSVIKGKLGTRTVFTSDKVAQERPMFDLEPEG